MTSRQRQQCQTYFRTGRNLKPVAFLGKNERPFNLYVLFFLLEQQHPDLALLVRTRLQTCLTPDDYQATLPEEGQGHVFERVVTVFEGVLKDLGITEAFLLSCMQRAQLVVVNERGEMQEWSSFFQERQAFWGYGISIGRWHFSNYDSRDEVNKSWCGGY